MSTITIRLFIVLLMSFGVTASQQVNIATNAFETRTNVLVLGQTHGGKTMIINKTCGSNRPVAAPGQTISTTTQFETQSCDSIDFTDSIGFYDFQSQSYESIDILRSSVNLISSGRVNAVAFVWPSKETVRNSQIEEIIDTLQQIAPGIPMVIVDNVFPSLVSGVPAALARKFNLFLVRVSSTDTSQLLSWAKDLTPKKYLIVPNYQDLLVKFSKELLEKKFQEVGANNKQLCDDFTNRTDNLRKRFENIQVPSESSCNRNCEVRHRYCVTKIIVCVDYTTKVTIDQNCVKLVEECKESLRKSNEERNAEKKALQSEISVLEKALPKSCRKS